MSINFYIKVFFMFYASTASPQYIDLNSMMLNVLAYLHFKWTDL